MFSFEGDYKRKPVQALGGSSKNESKEHLLQRTQEERRKRELQRLQLTSSVKIQSWYRSAKVRQRTKFDARQSFDVVCNAWTSTASRVGSSAPVPSSSPASLSTSINDENTVAMMFSLTRQLLFFYKSADDGQRLTWLCWQMVRHKQPMTGRIAAGDVMAMCQIKKLLRFCCRYIEMSVAAATANQVSVQLAMPMRMLEIYTDPAVYEQHGVNSSDSPSIVHQILIYLIKNDFYRCMRALVDAKIPSSIEPSTTSMTAPPTATAGSILTLIKRPLAVFEQSMCLEKTFRNEAMRTLCSALLCSHHTEQVHTFLLPSLAQTEFPFSSLLYSLVPSNVDLRTERGARGDWVFTVDRTLWLLYSILALSETRLDKLGDEELRLYLIILYKLVPQIRIPRRARIALPLASAAYTSAGRELSDSDDEEIIEMDTHEVGTTSIDPAMVRLQCLEKLDSPSLVRSLVRLSNNSSDDVTTTTAISALCHSLMADNKLAVHNTRLLYTLAYNPTSLRNIWHACTTSTISGSPQQYLLQMLSRGIQMSEVDFDCIVPLLSAFSSLFSHFLTSLHDSEFHGDINPQRSHTLMPFNLRDLADIALSLCDACLGIILLTHPESKFSYGIRHSASGIVQMSEEELQRQQDSLAYLFKVTVNLVNQLHERDCRRSFCPANHWITKHVSIQVDRLSSHLYSVHHTAFVHRRFGALSILNTNQTDEDRPMLSVIEARHLTILTEMPFVVPFQDRVKIFHKFAQKDKEDNQDGHLRNFGLGQSIRITVRRSHLYEDAFEKLSLENEPNLKQRMQVQLMNFAGLDEAGIDGGGIFREFMSELIKTAFDPNRGFFRATSDSQLYPNPQSKLLVSDYTKHYFFLGRILGKVIYENMLTELPFASFFLSKLRQKGNVDIHHLASLDPEMYKNLLFLKDYDGDVADLGLDFTVVNNELGEAQVEELKPGGRDILVTNLNRIEYMHLMADYRLNKQIKEHCAAFRQGLADVVNIEWLRMFDHNELQVLISGAQIPIDVQDLKMHTNYSGGYGPDHPVIIKFWQVVEELTDSQKRSLLKFVTSCSRPPLLGFKELYPAFCIHYAGSESDRLPTASTCMNLLKLPEFQDMQTLRQKLLYAIEAGAGFELS